jgi:hypothetical protein
MRLNLPVVALAALLPTAASAEGNLEVTGYLGTSFPFYSQSFTYSPGPVNLSIPGITITQEGVFKMDGSGGLVLSGGVTYYFGGVIGIEGRLDTVKLNVDTTGAKYDVRLTLPGLPQPFTASLDLGTGTADLSTLKPWSLNLKLRTPGPVRLFVSGGVSRLPALEFTVNQNIGLGATALNVITSKLDVGTVRLKGALVPQEGESRWGANAGGGLQLGLGPRVALVAEARFFYFGERTYDWSAVPTDRFLAGLEQRLLDATKQRLPAVKFKPQFFQATGGVSISF